MSRHGSNRALCAAWCPGVTWSSFFQLSCGHGLTTAGGGNSMAWHRAGTKEGSMTHLPLAALGLVSTLALAACTPSGIDMSTPASPSDAAARGQDGATYRTNPDRKSTRLNSSH